MNRFFSYPCPTPPPNGSCALFSLCLPVTLHRDLAPCASQLGFGCEYPPLWLPKPAGTAARLSPLALSPWAHPLPRLFFLCAFRSLRWSVLCTSGTSLPVASPSCVPFWSSSLTSPPPSPPLCRPLHHVCFPVTLCVPTLH
jgi:hypothetical protein